MKFHSLIITGAVTAVFCLAATFVFINPATGAACGSSKCTYFFANGTAVAGTCGSKKGDRKNCYCFDDSNKKLSQEQSGCAVQSK